MKIAYAVVNGVEQRIFIEKYTDDLAGKIVCAEGHPLLVRRGTMKCHHFAHHSNTPCSSSDGMTEWHSSWQDRADPEVQEVRFELQGSTVTSNISCHIADLCVPKEFLNDCSFNSGYVIEFQHSPMEQTTMREREAFYTSRGYGLVWVFDTSSWGIMTLRKYQENGMTRMAFRKKSGSTFPGNGSYTGSITKIFDFGKKELFVVTEQKGPTFNGYMISLEDFDSKYLGNKAMPNNDLRPFHHSLGG